MNVFLLERITQIDVVSHGKINCSIRLGPKINCLRLVVPTAFSLIMAASIFTIAESYWDENARFARYIAPFLLLAHFAMCLYWYMVGEQPTEAAARAARAAAVAAAAAAAARVEAAARAAARATRAAAVARAPAVKGPTLMMFVGLAVVLACSASLASPVPTIAGCVCQPSGIMSSTYPCLPPGIMSGTYEYHPPSEFVRKVSEDKFAAGQRFG